MVLAFRRGFDLFAAYLTAWFADPEDSKQVLRLATTLLTDSFRGILCLLYTPQQIACALVFLAVQIMSLTPQAPSSASGGYGGRGGLHGPGAAGGEVSWLDFFEKDADESVIRGRRQHATCLPLLAQPILKLYVSLIVVLPIWAICDWRRRHLFHDGGSVRDVSTRRRAIHGDQHRGTEGWRRRAAGAGEQAKR